MPDSLSSRPTAEQLIAHLGLIPLPEEGGYFRETYRSSLEIAETALGGIYRGSRNASTAIYYLVTPDEYSALHRLPSDEVFHFYAGDAVEMLQLAGEARRFVLGSQVLSGQHPQVVAPGHVWQGTRLVPGGSWALLGCTVAPGFDFRDFEIPTPAQIEELAAAHPPHAALIRALTPRVYRQAK